MNDTSISVIMVIVAVVAGVMLLTGHGDILMRGGNAELRNQIYDQKKFEKATGVAFLLAALATFIDMFTHTMAAKIVYTAVLVVIMAGTVIYIRKKCRKE